MSRVLLVHGIAQQYRGPESLRAECAPALCDGVALAGDSLRVGDVSVAFYGDVFRPPGSRSTRLPEYDVSDVDDFFERELLYAWWREAARIDPAVPGPDHPARARTPHWVQRALYALSGSSFFSGVAERAMIGGLKQVRCYFTDHGVRSRIRQRVLDAIEADTTVVVAHSLGSVVAYEALCNEPDTPVTTLVTVGSPLGIRNLVFDRLTPSPKNGRGSWPGNLPHWTNIADRGDIVALVKALAPLFGTGVRDVGVHNGAKAHDIRPYLTARETGQAVIWELACRESVKRNLFSTQNELACALTDLGITTGSACPAAAHIGPVGPELGDLAPASSGVGPVDGSIACPGGQVWRRFRSISSCRV